MAIVLIETKVEVITTKSKTVELDKDMSHLEEVPY